MVEEERQFPEFATGVFRGLYYAFLTDVNIFLLVLAAVGMSTRSRRARSFGKVGLLYVVFRRLDEYAGLFASKLDKIAAVKKETTPGTWVPHE